MSRKYLILGVLAIGLGILGFMSAYTVHQTKQAIVLQFGNPVSSVDEPGLHFKAPYQDVQYYEKRVLNLDPPVEQIILSDQKRLLVDTFARYKIINSLQFFQSARTEDGVKRLLGPIINASLRGVLGNVTLASVLSADRITILQSIRDSVNAQIIRFGIELVDVRIRRADLPDETSQAVFKRMQSEREREAAEFRAQGFELSQRIKATADREATVIVAEATRESEILRGQGEAKRTNILNDAFGQDASFFDCYRSMQAYEKALTKESTFLVLSPDSEFFRYFQQVDKKPQE